MDYQQIGLTMAKQFTTKEKFTIINKTDQRAEDNMILNHYYIIHMTELNICLLCQCWHKAFFRADIKVFGTIKDDVIDVISPIIGVSYDFYSHHFEIEYIKSRQFEKCIVYKYNCY